MIASAPKMNLSDIFFEPNKVKKVIEEMEKNKYMKGITGKPKTIRKHEGIVQRGSKKGKLRPGYKYVAGEKNNNGYTKIVKVSPKK